jgi:TRAP-type C4-dicarboxylate transport system permease small subunit
MVEILMAVCLGAMGILVFSNVLLRYFLNFSITWADEIARFLFIWVIFLGAVGALKENNHLGFTTLVEKSPKIPKTIMYCVSELLMLGCMVLLLWGTIKMSLLSTKTYAPATGIPLTVMYLVGIISSLAMSMIVATNVYKAIFGKGPIDKMVALKESEDEVKQALAGRGEDEAK